MDRLILAAILLLAVWLRVYRLDAQSLWYDEAITARVASMSLGELTRWTAGDIQPPLYYYVVHGWIRLAGDGEWALRFPSAFFSTLTIAALWSLARGLFGRTLTARWTAHIVALFAALSPLYVYYAQEARMYALLVFLAVLTAYALLRATVDSSRADRRAGIRWASFAASALALLYTHYFGAALLLALGIVLLCFWAVQRRGGHSGRRQIGLAIAAVFAILAGYAPWLPAMLARYQVDRSYWQGALKLGEALRHVAISFTSGAPETMLEPVAIRLLPFFGLAFALSLCALFASRAPDGERSIGSAWCLIGTLVIPVAAVLWLASRTPKFNARYLMLVSPAYLLLLAAGIGSFCARVATPRRTPEQRLTAPARSVTIRDTGGSPGRPAPYDTWRSRLLGMLRGMCGRPCDGAEAGARLSPGIALRRAALWVAASIIPMFVVGVSISALQGWYTDPAFTKAQWRELVTAVRAQIGPAEAVVLVSGHAAPAWDYYAPDLHPILLPDIDILDTDAVLGFESGDALRQGLAGKQGVWVVQWQADAVDPVGFVPFFLDRAGMELPVEEGFWQLGLRHWQLRPDATYDSQPDPVHPDGANFSHMIALLGWDSPEDGELTVYWRALTPLDRDFKVSMVIEDAAGTELDRWDGRPATYEFPTTRWASARPVFGRYPVPKMDGAGEFYVTLAVYDERDPSGLDVMDVADNPAGKRVRLGPIPMPAEQ